MNISRDLALSVFGLKDGYSEKELSDAYHRLAKITHPDNGGDNNLFILIKKCKDILDNKSSIPPLTDNKSNYTQKNNFHSKERGYLSLDCLYDVYYDLDNIFKKYDIV